MALLFFRSPEEPAQCALEISQALKDHPHIKLRMGVHSGPVNQVTDVNDKTNFAGSGINVAQRVMDCGDARHILLSAHVAEDLCQYRHWQPCLHDLGECEVKYGLRLHLFNFYKDGLGNPQVPEKLRRGRRRPASAVSVRPITAPRWPKAALAIAFLVSAVALVISSLIFFNRGPPTTVARALAPGARAVSALAAIPEKSIAVLPFENRSANHENAFFTDGVQDEILTDLAKVADLKVISRTSVINYRQTSGRNLGQIGQELRVAHVLEGSVQRAGNRVRVNVQLVDTRTDAHLWAQTYDRDLADVFAIQSEIAKMIADELQAKLSPSERSAIERPPTSDITAFDLYTRAKNLGLTASFNVSARPNLLQAVDLLNQTVAHDPSFFQAYCQLAHAQDALYFFGYDHTPARLAMAEAAIQAAFRLRPDAGEAHLARAENLYRGYLDYEGALAELEIAYQTLPNDAQIFELMGYIQRRQGHWEESTRNFERAADLDPRNTRTLQEIAITYDLLRRYHNEAATLDRALAVESKDTETQVSRAFVEFDWKADTRPLHQLIDSIRATNSTAIQNIANAWLSCALAERDVAAAQDALIAAGENPINLGRDVF
jgi:TolB-like protein/Tfp pilus assembly protein PilF